LTLDSLTFLFSINSFLFSSSAYFSKERNRFYEFVSYRKKLFFKIFFKFKILFLIPTYQNDLKISKK